MSGTAKEAERAQALRKKAAAGDQAAKEKLDEGDSTPFGGDAVLPRDPGNAKEA